MQAIVTKYHGPGNVRGSRVSATSESGKKVILSWDNAVNSEENHIRAAQDLCEKLNWAGVYHGGHTRDGMVFVTADPGYSFVVCKS